LAYKKPFPSFSLLLVPSGDFDRKKCYDPYMGCSAVFLCYWCHDYMVQMKSRVWLRSKYSRFFADGLSVDVNHFILWAEIG
jgi:hypothetical protein